MDYITIKEAAEKWDISVRGVQKYCEAGRIPGAVQPARDWLIPKDAEKPADARIKSGKYIKRKEGAE